MALEALVQMVYVRLLRAAVSFSRLSKHFGQPELESPADIDPTSQVVARDVGIAIARASRFAPFRCNCLTQAICGARMLKRRRISSTLYLGVDRDNAAGQEAHAWLRCGDCIITGNHQLERYRATFRFAQS